MYINKFNFKYTKILYILLGGARSFARLFAPLGVKIFQNPFLVDVQIMKINICPNFKFLRAAVTAVRASFLSQSGTCSFIYIDYYKRKMIISICSCTAKLDVIFYTNTFKIISKTTSY